jgi:hypothetical protein
MDTDKVCDKIWKLKGWEVMYDVNHLLMDLKEKEDQLRIDLETLERCNRSSMIEFLSVEYTYHQIGNNSKLYPREDSVKFVPTKEMIDATISVMKDLLSSLREDIEIWSSLQEIDFENAGMKYKEKLSITEMHDIALAKYNNKECKNEC